MAYSVRVRLRSTESAAVHDISHGGLLPAAILLRTHLESAALGVYCLDTVSDAARSGSTKELTEIMHKTLFGTALEKHVAGKEWVAELVSQAETNTIQICRAIDALDRYIYQDNASGEIGVVYSVLCEFAHPNHRGVKAFKTSASTAGGWTTQYALDEPFDPELAIRLLSRRLDASWLLRVGDAARMGFQRRSRRHTVDIALSRDRAPRLDHDTPSADVANAVQHHVRPDRWLAFARRGRST
jgi:hypothetical protein